MCYDISRIILGKKINLKYFFHNWHLNGYDNSPNYYELSLIVTCVLQKFTDLPKFMSVKVRIFTAVNSNIVMECTAEKSKLYGHKISKNGKFDENQ